MASTAATTIREVMLIKYQAILSSKISISIYENGVMGSQIYDNEFKYLTALGNNMEFSNAR
jgi:hypothetical protein